MNIHFTVEQNWICNLCGKQYKSNVNLARHMQRKHKLPPKTTKWKKIKQSNANGQAVSNEQFTCRKCDQGFNNESDLLLHHQEVHTGDRPYKCPLCDIS